jgi:hypothetical protein
MDYTLKYCYRYEPGFNVYSLVDAILFKSDGSTTPEINRYLANEEDFIEKENEHQLFFIVKHIVMAENISSIHFLKLALFPKEKKEDSVVNLVFYSLNKPWDEYLSTEKDELIKESVWEQERFVSLTYDIVDKDDMEIYVENSDYTTDTDE